MDDQNNCGNFASLSCSCCAMKTCRDKNSQDKQRKMCALLYSQTKLYILIFVLVSVLRLIDDKDNVFLKV